VNPRPRSRTGYDASRHHAPRHSTLLLYAASLLEAGHCAPVFRPKCRSVRRKHTKTTYRDDMRKRHTGTTFHLATERSNHTKTTCCDRLVRLRHLPLVVALTPTLDLLPTIDSISNLPRYQSSSRCPLSTRRLLVPLCSPCLGTGQTISSCQLMARNSSLSRYRVWPRVSRHSC
jgi:hypothetical protein